MARCTKCNKFMFRNTASGLCSDCEVLAAKKQEEKNGILKDSNKTQMDSGEIRGFVYETLPDGTLKITEYNELVESYECLDVPAELGGRKVSTIGNGLLQHVPRNTKFAVRIEEGITTIDGAGLFAQEIFSMPGIIEIYLPDSLKTFNGNPFYSSTYGTLQSSKIKLSPDHPYLIIHDQVLFGKTDKRIICYFNNARHEYKVPDGIRIIGKDAIHDDNLVSITLPESVERIEEAGINSRQLAHMNIPHGLKYIGKNAFPSKTVDGIYMIPRTVETIEPNAFGYMRVELECDSGPFMIENNVLIEKATKKALGLVEPNVSELEIPDSVEIIAKGAFSFSDIKRLTVPASVVTIEDRAFWYCSKLEEAILSSGVKKIGKEAFDDCRKLRITIPASVIEIGYNAFGHILEFMNIDHSKGAELLIVEKDSYAESYAKKNHYRYSLEPVNTDPMGWLNESSSNKMNDDLRYREALKAMREKQYDLAFSTFSELSAKGHLESMYQLGKCYEEGHGTSSNLIDAVQWYKCSANEGLAASQAALGYAYLYGMVVDIDYDMALYWNKKAADQGNGTAMLYLGLQYEEGKGVVQSVEKAHEYYQKSAEAGDPEGMCNNATDYLAGRGVPKDSTKAAFWNRRAARLGVDRAQFNLASQYFTGDGIIQDMDEARRWYREAARKGHPMAIVVCNQEGISFD